MTESEISIRFAEVSSHPENALTLELPVIKPNVTVPVIELFME